jgi:hypothetical protein
LSNLKAVILKGENHLKYNGTCNALIRITQSIKADYISTDQYPGKRIIKQRALNAQS